MTGRKVPIDIAGSVFGSLTARERVGSHNGKAIWICSCECGNESRVTAGNLRSGAVKSCGCQRAVRNREIFTTHGQRKAAEYRIWAAMKTRCENPHHNAFKYYGARGISVSPLWRDDFAAFLRDMGPRPSPKHSIDRINNDGNYEPGNCRWATAKEQVANRRPYQKQPHGDEAHNAAE